MIAQRRFVVGADGGNSKTDLAVAALDGTVLARVSGAGTRPQQVGVRETAQALAQLADAAIADAGVSGSAAASTFYLANVDTDADEAQMQAELATLLQSELLEVGNDTAAVLKAGSTAGWGVALVSGAGANALGVHPDGRAERFLGIGPLSGDWGGGGAAATAGIGAAVRAGDRRGPPTVLRDRVETAFGRPVETVALDADRGVITLGELLAFAPVVFAAASDGDAVAVAVVHRLADELVDFVRALVIRMDLHDTAFDVVLGGGTLQSRNPVLLDRFTAGVAVVAPKARLQVLDVPPVAGAVVSALTRAGAGPDAIDRVLEQFR